MKFLNKTSLFAVITSMALIQPLMANEVMSWVPASPTHMATIKSNLTTYPFVAENLNRVGLQFWHPDTDGKWIWSTEYSGTQAAPNATDVAYFRDFFHGKNVQVLATIYNAQNGVGWSWDKFFYALNNPDNFAQSALDMITTYGLDGVDMDLELTSNLSATDQAKYATLIQKLSAKLKPAGKVLTVDTFHSQCYNAPNVSWWADWDGYVDAIHTMGYQDLYEGNTASLCGNSNIFKFSSQQSYGVSAGYTGDQISMGMPGYQTTWGSGGLGTTPAAHISEILALPTPASIAIWDLTLTGANWKLEETWLKAGQIKAIGTPIVPTGGTSALSQSTQYLESNGLSKVIANTWTPQEDQLGKSLQVYNIQGELLGEFQLNTTEEIRLPGTSNQIRILDLN